MIDISEVLILLDDTKLFIESLRKKESFEFKPVKKGILQNSEKLTLGFSSYGIKLYFMLGMWDNITDDEKSSWIDYINTFQKKENKYGTNYYVDDALVNYYNKFDIKDNFKNVSKFLLNLVFRKNYDLNSVKLSKAINADTKQAISTLHEVGAKNLLPIPNKYDDNENLLNYLNSLDWSKPWTSGAQFSSLCVYSTSQGYKNKDILISFANNIADKNTGSYFKSKPKEIREIINGAMKVITGLDWIDTKIHYPEKLIDFCLNNEPVNEGCDIVDYIYVLYKCSEQTDYRNKEIQKTMENAIKQIKSLYVHEDKGFSYFKNRSQTHYYGVPFSEGLPTADLHGTILCVWGLLMALKTLKYDIKPYKIIKP